MLSTKLHQGNQMPKQPLVFTGCSDINFFIQPLPMTVSSVTFGNPNLTVQYLCYLQKFVPQHLSPGIFHLTLTQGSIKDFHKIRKHLWMCLCSHIQLISYQKILLGRFHLYVWVSCGTLYQGLTGFEHALLQLSTSKIAYLNYQTTEPLRN